MYKMYGSKYGSINKKVQYDNIINISNNLEKKRNKIFVLNLIQALNSFS